MTCLHFHEMRFTSSKFLFVVIARQKLRPTRLEPDCRCPAQHGHTYSRSRATIDGAALPLRKTIVNTDRAHVPTYLHRPCSMMLGSFVNMNERSSSASDPSGTVAVNEKSAPVSNGGSM